MGSGILVEHGGAGGGGRRRGGAALECDLLYFYRVVGRKGDPAAAAPNTCDMLAAAGAHLRPPRLLHAGGAKAPAAALRRIQVLHLLHRPGDDPLHDQLGNAVAGLDCVCVRACVRVCMGVA
jgi:hypothetical protein